MLPDLTIITPVLPERSRFLPDVAASVRQARALLDQSGLRLEWIIVIDGPGSVPSAEGADVVLRLPRQCGVSTARNTALSLARAPWVFPLDADDEVVPAGLLVLLEMLRAGGFTWAAGNRILPDGARTPHWFKEACRWDAGDLASAWSAPFVFHPNSVILERRAALAAGGWPAVPANEDMALVMAISEVSAGVSCPSVVTIYRPWDGQAVSDPAYPELKQSAFGIIEARTNVLRAAAGRAPVHAPAAGGAHGVRAL